MESPTNTGRLISVQLSQKGLIPKPDPTTSGEVGEIPIPVSFLSWQGFIWLEPSSYTPSPQSRRDRVKLSSKLTPGRKEAGETQEAGFPPHGHCHAKH
jgi:hypothetical protein